MNVVEKYSYLCSTPFWGMCQDKNIKELGELKFVLSESCLLQD